MRRSSRIAILGATGYVGSACQRAVHAAGFECLPVSRATVDYTRAGVLRDFLESAHPDFLINCAGYTGRPNVDACEDHKTECLAGNAVLPGIIREACEAAGIAWGHVSSGCIYNGTRPDGRGFTEEDPPNFCFRSPPCSFYSGCKALGEEVLAGAARCYVWRLRIPFNEVDHPRNYLTKLMRYERLLDARNSLSQLDEFARACLECWQRAVPFGVYNVTNPGAVTTREVVELIRQSGVVRKEFRFFESEAEFMRLAARAPRSNCVLDTGKLQRAGIQMTEIHEAIEHALRKWRTS